MNFDKKLAVAVGFLIVFGLVMMSSMSIASSFDITGENDFYLLRHFKYILIGIVGMAFAFRFPLDYMRKWSLPIYLMGISLMIATIWVGESYGTSAKLWLKIAGFSFQPIEIAKLTIIILISSIFASGKMHAENFENGFIPFAVVLGIPATLLVIQSDFGALL